MREQVKYPLGSLCKMAQFSSQPLCLPNGEAMVVQMPCGIDQVKDLLDIVGRYTNCDGVSINDKAKHPLLWCDDLL
jgi:hypothetical protein